MDSFPFTLPTGLTSPISPSSLLDTSPAIPSTQASTLAPSSIALDTHPSSSWLGLLAYALLAMAKGIPGLLIWIITFTTITLPTVLFALFSTSLTFTMNFTTLYVWPTWCQGPARKLNRHKDAHHTGFRVSCLLDREIPISEHVRATASRTSAQRASDRSLPRHARRRLKARSGKLLGRVSECHKSVWVS